MKKVLHSQFLQNIDSIRVPIHLKAPIQGSKWIYLSALQKAIRRGNHTHAQRASFNLLRTEPNTLWKRLVVIAFEDIAFGDIELLSDLVYNSQQWREKYGDEKIAYSFITRMCDAVKDRTVTNMYDIGTKQQPTKPTPPEIIDLAKQGCRITRHKFCNLLPLAYEMKELSSERYILEHRKLKPTKTINNWYPETYCMYTAEGKRCLGYLAKSCEPIRTFFIKHPKLNKSAVLGHALFHIESGLLNERLVYGNSEELYQQAALADLKANGVNAEEAHHIMTLMTENMDELNHIRRKLLTSDNIHLSELK